MNPIVTDFCEYYRELTPTSLPRLGQLYSVDAMFIDPVHSIEGLTNISRYFDNMVANINHCYFHIDQVMEADNQAFVTWLMDLSLIHI